MHLYVCVRSAGKSVPHESFRKDLYRQPSLTQQELYPEPYRRDNSYEHLRQSPSEEDLEAAATAAAAADDDVALLSTTQQQQHRRRPRGSRGTMSINVHEELDQGEDCQAVLKVQYHQSSYYQSNTTTSTVTPSPNQTND